MLCRKFSPISLSAAVLNKLPQIYGVNNIPCKNGRAQWDSSSVRYILRNEKYTGNSKWQKYYTPSTFPFHCKINAGEAQCYSSIPESRRCLLHGQHPSACPF